MRNGLVVSVGFFLMCAGAIAQGDVMMLLNPNPNTEQLILNEELSGAETVRAGNQGDSFGLMENQLSLRYALKLEDDKEFYLMLDTIWIDIDSRGRLDGSQERVPNDLYDVGVGLMFRTSVHETWKLGGTVKVGSASDHLFHSSEEWYLRSILFLQVPHLKYTSWVFVASIDTDREYPILPGFGYGFPLSEQTYVVLGIPFAGAAGRIGEKFSFQVSYWPLRNAYGEIAYDVTDRITAYGGFRWREIYFSRSDRDDSDDRIVLEDLRAFVGVRFSLTERASLDAKGGFIFSREISEGEDFDELDDNALDIDDAWFGSLALNVRF